MKMRKSAMQCVELCTGKASVSDTSSLLCGDICVWRLCILFTETAAAATQVHTPNTSPKLVSQAVQLIPRMLAQSSQFPLTVLGGSWVVIR